MTLNWTSLSIDTCFNEKSPILDFFSAHNFPQREGQNTGKVMVRVMFCIYNGAPNLCPTTFNDPQLVAKRDESDTKDGLLQFVDLAASCDDTSNCYWHLWIPGIWFSRLAWKSDSVAGR